jgi:hypothetical protein
MVADLLIGKLRRIIRHGKRAKVPAGQLLTFGDTGQTLWLTARTLPRDRPFLRGGAMTYRPFN